MLLSVLVISCSTFQGLVPGTEKNLTDNEMDTIKDPRDGEMYEIVKIGDQWWMAQNLNYKTSHSFYYEENSRNSNDYGRLYTFKGAKKACPDGWKLPTDQDWRELEKTLGMAEKTTLQTGFRGSNEGNKLKKNGNTGFNALLGGWRNMEGDFKEKGETGVYWTATTQNKLYIWIRGFSKAHSKICRRAMGKTLGFSVRCVKED